MKKELFNGIKPHISTLIFGLCFGGFALFWMIMVFSLAKTAMGLFGLPFLIIGLSIIISSIVKIVKVVKTNKQSAEMDEQMGGNPLQDADFGTFEDLEKHKREAMERDEFVEDFDEHENNFCPYCGNTVDSKFKFCNSCGAKLPEKKDNF